MAAKGDDRGLIAGFKIFFLKTSFRSPETATAMLNNDIKIAARNLRKHKFFSALNIAGLALSMSAALLLITVIRNQFGFDEFHPAPERTYRVITEALRKEGGSEKYASTPYPVGTALLQDYAVAETVTRLGLGPNADAEAEGKTLPIRGMYADPAFFRVFGFQLAAGNAATALDEPFSIVLTPETATRFFGQADPMNKTLDLRGYGKFKVTGVLRPTEHKTHLRFEALASAATQAALEKDMPPEEAEFLVTGNWLNYYRTYTYALLQPGKTGADLQVVLDEIAATRFHGLTLESRDAGYRFKAQHLSKISPADEILSQSMEVALPKVFIWGLSGFVLLLMLFPCLNYANLTIARALVRAKEVGIRKVMGARRRELVRQFLTEAIVTATLALGLAWLLRLPLIGLLHGLAPDTDSALYSPFLEDWKTYGLFAVFTLAVGLASGWLPAAYLSRFRPDAALRDASKVRLFSRLNLRKALIVTQFSVSLIMLIVVATLWKQLSFAATASYGFDRENIVNVELGETDYRALAAELSRDHRVLQVSASSHTLGTWEDGAVDLRKTRDGEPVPLRNFAVDQAYVANHGLSLLAGENFPADANPQRQQYVLLNEKALELFALGTPQEAVGKTLWLDDSTELAVLGVLKNYHFRPFTNAIGPLVLMYAPGDFRQLNVRLAPGNPAGAIAAMEGIWKKFDPVHAMRYGFLDEQVRACYEPMRKTTGLVLFFALLAISVACLGLLGIVTFGIETRAKELSIRKVVGASVSGLVFLLSRNYLALLAIAILIALPVAWLLSNQLLNTFAYRISLGADILLSCVATLLGLALATVGWQTLRAAQANPVDKLRNE